MCTTGSGCRSGTHPCAQETDPRDGTSVLPFVQTKFLSSPPARVSRQCPCENWVSRGRPHTAWDLVSPTTSSGDPGRLDRRYGQPSGLWVQCLGGGGPEGLGEWETVGAIGGSPEKKKVEGYTGVQGQLSTAEREVDEVGGR